MSRRKRGLSGKYGEEEEEDENPLSEPEHGSIAPPQRPSATFEDTFGIKEGGEHAFVPNEDVEKISDTKIDDGCRKETIGEQDARLKREAQDGPSKGVKGATFEDAVGLKEGDEPELIPDSSIKKFDGFRKETAEERDVRLKREALNDPSNVTRGETKSQVSAQASKPGAEAVSSNGVPDKEIAKKSSAIDQRTRAGAEKQKEATMAGTGSSKEIDGPGLFAAEEPDDSKQDGPALFAVEELDEPKQDGPGLFAVEEPDDSGQDGPGVFDADETYDSDIQQPGAVRVRGVDGNGEDDGDHNLDYELRPDPPARAVGATTLPEAFPVEEDEEEGVEADPEELFDGLVRAQEADSEEFEKERGGVIGWMERHTLLAIVLTLVVVGVVVGGIVAGITGGSEPSPAPPPTLAPTTTYEGKLLETMLNFAPLSVLLDEETPQGLAFKYVQEGNFFLIEDEVKSSERYALAAIYYATNGPEWTDSAGFLLSDDYCDWFDERDDGTVGVQECNNEGLVESLFLSSNNLNGSLPEELGILTGITYISIPSNPQLGGSIPKGLTALTKLTDLRIFRNSLTGSLPADFGNLSNLEYLAMQRNSFTGKLPPSIGQLTNLELWFFGYNSFTGRLPSEIGNLGNLTTVFFESNEFTGSIPEEVSGMVSLRSLYIDKNNFTDGADNFCTEDIPSLLTFQSDCLASVFPEKEPEIACSCCSTCCSDVLKGCNQV